MAKWTLCFALLMPLIVRFGSTETFENSCGKKLSQTDAEVTLVKTIGTETDVTPVCSNDTLNVIILIVCKISTKRTRGVEPCLFYKPEIGFENKCDSRFRLMTDNQTVSLQLSSLTPEDGGRYTCECSCIYGTSTTHLNVTVEESKDASTYLQMPMFSLTVVSAVVIITGIILGFIYRRRCHRKPREPLSTLQITGEDDSGDRYMSLQPLTSDLYQTMHSVHTTDSVMI